jgi:hypothetical protein
MKMKKTKGMRLWRVIANMSRHLTARHISTALLPPALLLCATLTSSSCARASQKTFETPEAAVRALSEAANAKNVDEILAIFGPDGRDLLDSSDARTARRNLEVFTTAFAERWRLDRQGPNSRVLVIGREDWPFPVPLTNEAERWRFDTTAGRSEVIDRRIGRNELAAMRICRTYVTAQQLYARDGHDGKPAGLYARAIRSDEGRENGLYWPSIHGRKLSPLGDLIATAAADTSAQDRDPRQPFHGYYFRILTAQGAAAPGGAKDYLTGDALSGGFALIAWPAEYDVTGIMTFMINQDGVLHEKALGPDTAAAVKRMLRYDPDASWTVSE